MAVAAQVEQDDPGLAGLLGGHRLVDRDAERVGGLGRGQDASVRANWTPAAKLERWWTALASM